MLTFEFLSNKKNVSQKLNILAILFMVLSVLFAVVFYRFYTHSNANFDRMIEIHTKPLSHLVEIKDIYDVNIFGTINQARNVDYLSEDDVKEILLVANKLTKQAWNHYYRIMNDNVLHVENKDKELDTLIHETEESLLKTYDLINQYINQYINHKASDFSLRTSVTKTNELLTKLIKKEIDLAQKQQLQIKKKRADLTLTIIPIAGFLVLILIYFMLSKNIKNINYELESALSLFDNGKFVVFKWRAEEGWPVEFVSNNVEEVIGIPKESFFEGDTVYSNLINPKHLQRVTDEVIQNSVDGIDMFTHEPYQIRVHDDKYLWVYDSTTIIRDDEGNITHYVGYIHGIDEHVKKENDLKTEKTRLDFVAHHDELTKLPNRILFMDRVEQAIKKYKRRGEIFAILFIDLDHFKEINDGFGHDIGDKVLQEVAIRLQNVIRDIDTVSRWGGDEFVILLEHIKDTKNIVNIANKILEEFRRKIIITKEVFFISTSIGVAMYPNDGKDINTLLKNADTAMYEAKDDGRNNYQFYAKEMTSKAFEKVILETELRNAIQNNELKAYYQAQIDLKTDKLIGAEALVRWEHPTLGLVSPAHFIPLAEESDLIVYLGNWMLEETMTQMLRWQKEGLKPQKVSVNLSGKQIARKDLVQTIKNLLEKTRCRADSLELEVTEGFIMKHPELAIDNLNKLRDIGIEIAIDDFGTGYSSLSYLKKLPITKLKIDQSFVLDIETDEDDKAIVKAVVALSHGLGLRCIAEGVETQEQKEYLISEGCDEMQGYLYSRPISADEYKEQILT